MTSTPTAQRLIYERNLTACECCGGALVGCEAHHCLYKKDNKTKGAKKLLNMNLNFQVVCHGCHHVTKRADTHENRVNFWHRQCCDDRFGHSAMLEWHDKIKLIYKVTVYEYC